MIDFSYFPLSVAILFPLKLIITYVLALYYGHVNPVFPYISDAGTTSPEAGYFSIFLFSEALLIGITCWIRFQQIKYICNNNTSVNNNNKIVETDEIPKLLLLNKYGFYAALIILISMPIVGAFRSVENLALHLVGALTAFGISGLFLAIQTKMSYSLIPGVNSLRIARIRLICTVLAVVSGALMMLAILISAINLKVPINKIVYEERLKWDESYGGYIAHCFSALFEWLAIFIISPFFATFVPEFKSIESHNGEIKCKFVETSVSSKL